MTVTCPETILRRPSPAIRSSHTSRFARPDRLLLLYGHGPTLDLSWAAARSRPPPRSLLPNPPLRGVRPGLGPSCLALAGPLTTFGWFSKACAGPPSGPVRTDDARQPDSRRRH